MIFYCHLIRLKCCFKKKSGGGGGGVEGEGGDGRQGWGKGYK